MLQQVRLTRNWSKNDFERTMFHGVHYQAYFAIVKASYVVAFALLKQKCLKHFKAMPRGLYY